MVVSEWRYWETPWTARWWLPAGCREQVLFGTSSGGSLTSRSPPSMAVSLFSARSNPSSALPAIFVAVAAMWAPAWNQRRGARHRGVDDLFDLDHGVPDVEVRLRGHRGADLAVGWPRRRSSPARGLGKAEAAADHEAGPQSLDVPLPGTGQRLVEVVAVEDQLALGRPEDPEVREGGAPPQIWALSPQRGVADRSDAMTRAGPWKNVNGETSIRP